MVHNSDKLRMPLLGLVGRQVAQVRQALALHAAKARVASQKVAMRSKSMEWLQCGCQAALKLCSKQGLHATARMFTILPPRYLVPHVRTEHIYSILCWQHSLSTSTVTACATAAVLVLLPAAQPSCCPHLKLSP